MHPVILVILSFAGAFACKAVLDHLASTKWRKCDALHWAERARLLYPVRVSSFINLCALAACAALFGWRFSSPHPVLLAVYTFSALIGGALGSLPFERKIFPEISVKQWCSQLVQGWGSRLLLFGPILLAALLMPREWNTNVAVIAILFAGWSLWFGSVGYFQVLIWLKMLKRAHADSFALLEDCFRTTGVRPRAVWIMQTPLALAFAVPTRHELLFSDTFLRVLSEDDIKVVCHHELAHLTEDRFTIARRMLGVLLFYPFIFISPCVASWGMTGFLPIYAAFGVILFFNNRLGKAMERRADAEALSRQANEGAYARALENLYRINQIPAVLPSRGQVHPHLYDRMLHAGVTPDFPRPKPPAAADWTILIPIALAIALAVSK